MSDRIGKASPEWQAEVARRLGFKPDEVLAVYGNADGVYAVVKDGHRLLLAEDGSAAAWYGDKAPNPSLPLVVPSVELDESDEPEEQGNEPADEAGGTGGPKPPPKHGTGSGKDAWAAYAAEHLEVPDGATREQIWHLLEQANIPTE